MAFSALAREEERERLYTNCRMTDAASPAVMTHSVAKRIKVKIKIIKIADYTAEKRQKRSNKQVN
jgi:hypothetical protein